MLQIWCENPSVKMDSFPLYWPLISFVKGSRMREKRLFFQDFEYVSFVVLKNILLITE